MLDQELKHRYTNEIIKTISQSTNDESDIVNDDDDDKPCIVDYQKAPIFTKDNRYLLRGYRNNYDTPIMAFKSIFHWHNETCNIWTHLIPLILVTFAFIYLNIYDDPFLIGYLIGGDTYQKNIISTISIKFALAAGIYLFAGSTLYHTMFCVNEAYSKFFLRIDYSAICLIAASSFTPIIYYGFYCQPNKMYFYLSLTLTMSLITMILCLTDAMHRENFIVQKSLIIMTLFTINLTPALQVIIYDAGNLDFYHAEQWLLYQIISCIIGTTVFASRFPEKQFPNRFDYLFGSHQIWHTFVFFTYVCNYFGSLSLLIDRSNNQCDLNPINI